MTDQHKHGIKTVAIQTGLTQLIIRAWEKRYNVVTTAANRNESSSLFRCGYIATHIASSRDASRT